MLILDGLDEQAGASGRIIEEALKGKHALLATARPYGVANAIEEDVADLYDINKDYDIKVTHTGMNAKQVATYVQQQIPDDEAAVDQGLAVFIKEHSFIQSLASIPVNLKILCALWQNENGNKKIRQWSKNGSLSLLYYEMTEYLWDRYYYEEERQGGKEVFDKREQLFKGLENLALTSLKKLQEQEVQNNQEDNNSILIKIKEVEKIVRNAKVPMKMLEKSGLLQKAGTMYYFPHLTFQEYFAGRALARQWLSGNNKEQDKTTRFFRDCKYAPAYGVTLSFMDHWEDECI